LQDSASNILLYDFLIGMRGKQPRMFADPRKAMLLLRDMGIRDARLDTQHWRPDQADLLRQPRPAAAAQMKAAHEAAEIKRTLEAAIKQAGAPKTVWVSHDDLFNEIEASLAD
jgi:hypothetical protein